MRPMADQPRRRTPVCGRAAVMMALLPAVAACAYVERGRAISDAALSTTHEATLGALVEAEEQRLRLRRRRCYNPMLTPAAISAAAADPRLGAAWVAELFADCPQFAAFVSEQMLQRGAQAGLLLPPPPPACR